jgi:hypothetical protein
VYLARNRPNPFEQTTAIRFHLPRSQSVKVDLFSIRGRRLARLAEGVVPAGWSEVTWDGRDGHGNRVAPGLYVCRIAAEDGTRVRNIVLLR